MLLKLSHAFFRHHPGQLLLALIGIAAGIAVVTGVALLRDALVESLDAAASELAGADAVIVTRPSGSIPVEDYVELARRAGAPDLLPILRIQVRAAGQRLEVLGVDPFAGSVGTAGPGVVGPVSTADLRAGPDELPPALAGPATLELLGVEPGDTLELESGRAPVRVRIAGTLAARPGLDRRLVMDIALAQQAFGRRDGITELLAGPDSRDWIDANLPDGLVWQSAGERRDSARQLTAGMRANLGAMSLLALATGLFVVFSVLSFLMVQRKRLFGMLRALGLTHRSLTRMLVTEALMLGVIGSLAGLVVGTFLADRLLALVANPVSEIYGQLPLARSNPSLGLYGLILAVGVLAALAVTVPILREALRVQPGRLAKSGPGEPASFAGPVVAAAILVAAGFAWLLLDARLVAALGGLFLVLAGLILVLPTVGFGMLGLGARLAGPGLVGRAWALLLSSRSRLAPAVAALALALALAIGMGMMILGFRVAVDDWVERLLRADLYVAAENRPMTPAEVRAVAELDEVEAYSTVRGHRLGDGTRVTAYDLPDRAWGGFEWLAGEPAAVRQALETGRGVAVSEPLARRLGLEPGAILDLAVQEGLVELPVVGVFRDYSSERGFIAVDAALARQWFDDDRVDSIGLYLGSGVSPEETIARLETLDRDGTLDWVTPATIRDQSLAVFDRTFRISWAMAVLVGMIALVALISALLAQGLERSREYATLRALGLSPARLAGLVTAQTVGLTAVSLMLALPLAVLIHYALTLFIQPRAFGWSLPMELPPAEPMLWVVPAALIVGTLAGLFPAWRIASRAPADGLRAR